MAGDSVQKFKIGLFVVGGLALLLAVLFFLGMSDFFVRKAAVQTYFSESVQGLTVGSQVKYRGVPIGTVTKIVIRVSDKLVQVDMAVELDHFVSTHNRSQQLKDFQEFFQSELDQGMRCRLEYTGITGMKYIDFDYYATPGQPLPSPPAEDHPEGKMYIPAVPSPFHDLLKAVVTSLERISRIRFEEISDGLEQNLNEMALILSDPALKSTIASINEAAENIEAGSRNFSRVFTEERLTRLATLLQEDLESLNRLAEHLINESSDMKLAESSTAFRDAAISISMSQEELANALSKFNQMVDTLTELLDMLNDDPSSLVRGKHKTQ